MKHYFFYNIAFYLTIFLIIFVITLSQTQSTFIKSIDISRNNDQGVAIRVGDDGYYIVSDSRCFNNTLKCFSILKIDLNGEKVWKKQYDNHPFNISPTDLHSNQGIHFLNDHNELYYCGEINNSNSIDGFLMKTDINGDSVWLKVFNEPLYNNISDIFAFTDTSFIIFGLQELSHGSNETWIAEVNLEGDVLSEIRYQDEYERSINQDITTTENGDLVFSYLACKEHKDCKIGEEMSLKLVRMSKSGDLLWDKEIYSFKDFWSNSILQRLDNGGYLLSFYKMNYEKGWFYPPIIIWTDSLGEVQNIHEFPAITESTILDMQIRSNGSIVGVGTIDKLELGYAGWIFALSPTGELLWERSIIDTRYSEGFVQCNAVTENEDGDLLICGVIGDTLFNNNSIYSNKNVLILKTDETGCLNANCEEIQTITFIDEIIDKTFSIYPNPANGIINIVLPDNIINKNNYLTISNFMGNIIKSVPIFNSQSINVEDLGTGLFICSIVNFDLGVIYKTKYFNN